jgi:hypothetical protein
MAQGLQDFKSRGSHAAVPFADDEPVQKAETLNLLYSQSFDAPNSG